MTDSIFKMQNMKTRVQSSNLLVYGLIIFLAVIQCSCNLFKSAKNQYLIESSEETKNANIRLYTINSTDTFFYNKRYLGESYNDGMLVFEKHNRIIWERQVANRKYNGIYRSYFESGHLRVEGLFINNLREGIWLEYRDSDKQCVFSISFYEQGQCKKMITVKNEHCLCKND